MGIGAPNPGIWDEAVRKVIASRQDRAAQEHEANAERALLDAAELREVERAELYGRTPQVREPSRRRRFLDWLLRRST